MSANQPIPWKFIAVTLLKFAPFWCGLTLLCGALGLVYSLMRSDVWEASQPLLIRDEANGSELRLGRFASQSELLAAQETILEMARNREVVERALIKLGPYKATSKRWPTLAVIDDVATSWIKVRAPKASEFGKTEVVYLATKAETPERAERFCEVLFDELVLHLKKVRQLRADSVIQELEQAAMVAQSSLDTASKELSELESRIGTDLGDLRGLSESLSGEAGSARVRTEVDKEIREAELSVDKLEALMQVLRRSEVDPSHLLVSDAELLSTQPTLQRLKSGLIDAQLESSKLAGRVTSNHPRMQAAMRTLQTIQDELRAEIANVIKTMGPALELAQRKVQTLIDKQSDVEKRLAALAAIRADYSRLVAEVKNRTEIVSQAQVALTEAQALRSAAFSTTLLSRLGPAKASENPVGIGTATITVGTTAAGLLIGLGGVFLVAPLPGGQRQSRRFSDSLAGRRATDILKVAGSEIPETAASIPDRRSLNRMTGEPNRTIPTSTNPAPIPPNPLTYPPPSSSFTPQNSASNFERPADREETACSSRAGKEEKSAELLATQSPSSEAPSIPAPKTISEIVREQTEERAARRRAKLLAEPTAQEAQTTAGTPVAVDQAEESKRGKSSQANVVRSCEASTSQMSANDANIDRGREPKDRGDCEGTVVWTGVPNFDDEVGPSGTVPFDPGMKKNLEELAQRNGRYFPTSNVAATPMNP